MTRFTSPQGRAWIWTVLYTVVVIASAGYVRPVARAVRRLLGPAFGFVAALCYVALGAWFLTMILRRPSGRARLTAFTALALVLLTLALFLSNIESPEERIHFVQFGVLGGLALRAFEHQLGGVWLYAATTGYTLVIGIMDELYQRILPDRFFDVRDIWMNAAGGILGWVTLRFILTRT